MAISSLALSAAGGVSNSVGAYYGAKSQKTAYNSAADAAEANAKMAELQAQSEIASGQREEQKVRLNTAQLKGAQRASMAANGIDLGEGTANQIQTSTDYMGEVDALTVRQNAVKNASDARMQGANYQNEARTDRATARAINPSNAAFSSLLGTASDVSAKWYGFQKSGADMRMPWDRKKTGEVPTTKTNPKG